MVGIRTIRLQQESIQDRLRKARAMKEQNEQIRDEIRRAKSQMVEVKLFQGEAKRIEQARKGGRIKLGW